jgi:8-amino-7-oxononanoate synthase
VTWTNWAEGELDAIRAAGRWRSPRSVDLCGPTGTLDGQPIVSFASNDYLGLSAHPAVTAAAHAAIDRWGAGSTSARLIVGNRPVHDELEHALADWKQTERAVIFPTGFAANLGVMTVFGGPEVTVLSDELNHASIIDGCRLGRSRTIVFRHNDLDHLRSKLDGLEGRAVVVSDTIFSMDGDAAHLDELVDLCAERGALLVLDEAHSVLRPDLANASVLHDAAAPILRVGTMSKTLGSLGGFVAGPAEFTDLLVNRARSYIFTTGSSPADAAAALAALGVWRSDEGLLLVERLRRHVDRLRPEHPSPIMAVLLGDEQVALDAARSLLEQGLLVPAIRPPTVAPGTSRLRVTLSAAHHDDDIDRLVAALSGLPAALSPLPGLDTSSADRKRDP